MNVMTSTALSLVIGLIAAPALAQIQPSTIDPARIQERFEIEKRPSVSGDSIIENKTTNRGKRLTQGTQFTLRGIDVEGNMAISDAELEALYADRIGQKITLRDLQQIADSITAYYREQGYILSQAIVPAQRIGDNVVKIQLIEGFVDKVSFQGVGADSALIQEYAAKIKASMPLNSADLERYLLLIDDLSGLSARATLSAGEGTLGASNMIISLEESPVTARINVNNRGSRFLGPVQADALVDFNNLGNQHGNLRLRSIQSVNLDELNYYEVSYTQPVGSEGTKLRGLASYTQTEPGNGLAQLNLEGESKTFRLEATHPFLRSRRANVFGTVALTYRDTDSESFGLQVFEDNIRNLSAQVAYDFYDDYRGINQIAGGMTQGLDILGANDKSDPVSRANADASYTYVTLDAQRLQSISGPFALQLSASGQYSLDPLLASEEFAVGGVNFGSAYDPAELTGDSGLAFRSELHYNSPLTAQWVNDVLFYGFYDIGKIWNRDEVAGEDDSASLASAGLGVRSELLDALGADLEVAFPLTRNVAAENSGGDEPRIFFNLTYDFE